MGITFLDGFEHGGLSAAGGGLWDSVSGFTTADIQTSVTKYGSKALRANTSASAKMLTCTISQSVVVAGFHVYRASTPGSSRPIVRIDVSDTNMAYVRINTSNQLDLATWNGTTETVLGTGPTLTLNTWYWVDLIVDATANPWSVDWAVDGTDQTGGTLAVAAATLNKFRLGDAQTTTRDFYLDNIVVADSTADYPLGEHKVLGHSITGVGTHNLDAATSQFFFKDVSNVETALTTSETTSYQTIDDPNIGNTDVDHIVISPIAGTTNTPAPSGTPGAIAASASNVANPTSLTPALPTGYSTGDTLLCFTTCRSATPTVATPSGWTSLLNTTGTNGRIAVFALVSDGTETAPTVTWSGMTTGNSGTPAQAQIAAFSNVDPGLSVDVTGAVENGAASTTVAAGGANVTTTLANVLVLSLTTRLDDAGTISAGTGFTLIGQGGTTSGADKSQAWSYQVKATAGSVTVPDFSLSGASSFASSGIAIGLAASSSTTQPNAAHYAEYTFADTSETVAPEAIRVYLYMRNDVSGSNSVSVKMSDGGGESNVLTNYDVSTNGGRYRTAVLSSKPSGGAWTISALNALALRYGYSNDADGRPRLVAATVEAAFPVVIGGTLHEAFPADTLSLSDTILAAERGFQTVADDVLVLDDASSQGYGKGLADTSSLADAQALGFGEGIADTATTSDAQSLGIGEGVADSVSVGDSASAAAGKEAAPADNLSLADAQAKDIGQATADAASLADAQAKDVSKNGIADTANAVDALSIGPGKGIADIAGLADSTTQESGKGVSVDDSAGLVDAQAKDFNKATADTASLADAQTKDIGQSTSDTASVADAQAKDVSKNGIADTATATDALSLGYGEGIADTLTLDDLAITDGSLAVVTNDNLSLADLIVLGYGEGVADTLSLADAQALGLHTAVTDNLSLADAQTLARGIAHSLNDNLSLADAQAIALGIARSLNDNLSLADAQTFASDMARSINDNLSLADAASASAGFSTSVPDVLVLVDDTSLFFNKLVADTLTLADEVTGLDFNGIYIHHQPPLRGVYDRESSGVILAVVSDGTISVYDASGLVETFDYSGGIFPATASGAEDHQAAGTVEEEFGEVGVV